MSKPMTVDLPHNLGAEEAKRRMRGGVGKIKDKIPGGNAEVDSSWDGDRMNLSVKAMGQEVNAKVDVEETRVRLHVKLPGFLAMFGSQIEGLLRKSGKEMLEDKSKPGA